MGAAPSVVGRVLRAVSFGAFLSTLLIYSPNVMVLQKFDLHEITGFFAEPCLVLTLLVSGLVAALAYVRACSADRFFEKRVPATAFLVLYGVSGIIYAASVVFSPPGTLLWAVACAVVCGLCVVPGCLSWRAALSDFDFCRATLLVAVGGIFAALANTGVMMLAPVGAFVAFSVLVLVGVLYPILATWNVCPTPVDVRVECTAQDLSEISSGCGHIDIRAFLSVMGIPLLGMAISSFAMGVRPAFLFDGTVDAQRLAMLIGGCALLPLAFMRSFEPIFTFTHRIYLSVAAAVALTVCVVSPDLLSRDVATLVVYAFYCMVTIVACAAALAVANAHEFSPAFVFATLVGTFSLMGVFGIFVGARFGTQAAGGGPLFLVLTALYACGLLLEGCIKAWHATADRNGGSPVFGRSPEPPESVETLDQRIARLARDSGLSPRETEIVGYVGRGHSSVYVAKTLLISESTVYSHVRNVYRKLGVSSREELIQLLNGSDVSLP